MILLALLVLDLASDSVSVPAWAWIVLVIAYVVFDALEGLMRSED